MSKKLEVIDNGDFWNVYVEGEEMKAFTKGKDADEWGCAPEDNRPTWEALCEKAGFGSDAEAESALDAAVEALEREVS